MNEIFTHPLFLVALGIAAVYGGKFFFKFDKAVEARRRAAGQVAGILRAKGLSVLPAILEDYGVGDYVGVAEKMEKAAVVFTHDPQNIEKEFEDVFRNVLIAKLADPAAKAALISELGLPDTTVLSVAPPVAPPVTPPVTPAVDPVTAVLADPSLQAALVAQIFSNPLLKASFTALIQKGLV